MALVYQVGISHLVVGSEVYEDNSMYLKILENSIHCHFGSISVLFTRVEPRQRGVNYKIMLNSSENKFICTFGAELLERSTHPCAVLTSARQAIQILWGRVSPHCLALSPLTRAFAGFFFLSFNPAPCRATITPKFSTL